MAALTELIQFRCSEEDRQRAIVAAAECEMTLGEWSRAVFKGALDVHFDDHADGDAGPEIDVPDPSEDPDGYTETIEREARATRAADTETPATAPNVVHPGLHEEELSPRDCPHLPQWRLGALCRCGATVGGRRSPAGRIPTHSVR